MSEKLNYFDIYNEYTLSPLEYAGAVEAINHNNLRDLQDTLKDFPLQSTNFCVIVMGSDGKLERHPQSKTELVFLQRTQEDDLASNFSEWYKKNFACDFTEHFEFDPHTKLPGVYTIEGNTPLSFAYGDPNAIYPDIILNSQIVFGERNVLQEAKQKVLAETTQDDKLGKRIRRILREQIKEGIHSVDQNLFMQLQESPIVDLKKYEGKFHKKIHFTLDPPHTNL